MERRMDGIYTCNSNWNSLFEIDLCIYLIFLSFILPLPALYFATIDNTSIFPLARQWSWYCYCVGMCMKNDMEIEKKKKKEKKTKNMQKCRRIANNICFEKICRQTLSQIYFILLLFDFQCSNLEFSNENILTFIWIIS